MALDYQTISLVLHEIISLAILQYQALIAVVVSAVVVILGYIVNGREQRTLERKRTNYNTKLKAFQELNRATIGLSSTLMVLSSFQSTRLDAYDNKDLLDLISLITETRGIETPLGSRVTQQMADQYTSASEIQDEAKRTQAIHEWMADTRMSVLFLLQRALNHYGTSLVLHSADASLVAESDDVETALGTLQGAIDDQVATWAKVSHESPPSVDAIIEEFSTLQEKWNELKRAMRSELSTTL